MSARSRRPDNQPKLQRPKSSRIITSPPAPLKARAVVEWAVYRLQKKAQYIGRVQTADQKEALERAFEEYEVPQPDRFRISVIQLSIPRV